MAEPGVYVGRVGERCAFLQWGALQSSEAEGGKRRIGTIIQHHTRVFYCCVSLCAKERAPVLSSLCADLEDTPQRGQGEMGPVGGAYESTKCREGCQKGHPSLDLLLGEEENLGQG